MGYMRGYFDDEQYPVADFDPALHSAGTCPPTPNLINCILLAAPTPI